MRSTWFVIGTITILVALFSSAHGSLGWDQLSAHYRAKYNVAAAGCDGLGLGLFQGGRDFERHYSDFAALDVATGRWKEVEADSSSDLQNGANGNSLTVLSDTADACVVLMFGAEDFGIFESRSPGVWVGKVFKDQEKVKVQWKKVTEYLNSDFWNSFEWDYTAPDRASKKKTGQGFQSQFFIFIPGRTEMSVMALSMNIADSSSLEVISFFAEHVAVEAKSRKPPALHFTSATLLEKNTESAYVLVGGSEYGEDRAPHSSKHMWKIDIQAKEWDHVPVTSHSQLFHRQEHQAVAMGDKLFLHGGRRFVYNTGSDTSAFNVEYYDNLLVSTPLELNPQKLCQEIRADGWFEEKQEVDPENEMENLVESSHEYFCEAPMLKDSDGPSSRAAHSAVRVGEILVVYGGYVRGSSTQTATFGDTWRLNLTKVLLDELVPAFEYAPDPVSTLLPSIVFFFGALILLLLFCAVRTCRDRMDDTLVDNLNNGVLGQRRSGSRAVPEEEINRLPEITFDRKAKAFDQDTCPICLVEFHDCEKIVALPCNHVYHRECCTEWLLKFDACPMCKRSILFSLSSDNANHDDLDSQNDCTRSPHWQGAVVIV